MPERDLAFSEVRRLLQSAKNMLVLTGAGVSAESGVPTFRGPDGLWKKHRPEQLATAEAFRADPRLVWEWYGWRRQRVAACSPNAAHEAMARLTVRDPRVRIVTQNVDGLHELALQEVLAEGTDSDGSMPDARPAMSPAALSLELHGSLYRVRCLACRFHQGDRNPIDATSAGSLPHCPECGSLLRPDVVWFGESLDENTLEAAVTTAQGAEVCLVVGTSAVVHPAASLPLLTRQNGGVIVEVNPEPTPLSAVARVSLRAPATEVIPLLLDP